MQIPEMARQEAACAVHMHDSFRIRDHATAVGRCLRYSRSVPVFRIREAADLLGVSYDTMLRWADSGRIEKITDGAGRLAVDGAALAEFARERAVPAASAESAPVAAQSVRNRFTGLVTRVVKDTVMAQVEIQAGPHRFVSLLSREAADELGLEPGMLAVAAVKATNVAVEIPAYAARRPAARPGAV